MSDYHNSTHRAVGPDLGCKVCKLLDLIGTRTPAEQESMLDRLLTSCEGMIRFLVGNDTKY